MRRQIAFIIIIGIGTHRVVVTSLLRLALRPCSLYAINRALELNLMRRLLIFIGAGMARAMERDINLNVTVMVISGAGCAVTMYMYDVQTEHKKQLLHKSV